MVEVYPSVVEAKRIFEQAKHTWLSLGRPMALTPLQIIPVLDNAVQVKIDLGEKKELMVPGLLYANGDFFLMEGVANTRTLLFLEQAPKLSW